MNDVYPAVLSVDHAKALLYIYEAAGQATINDFDEDHDPEGPTLRANIMPKYAVLNGYGGLELTEYGKHALMATGMLPRV